MRYASILASLVVLAACTKPMPAPVAAAPVAVTYVPTTFRADVAKYVAATDYASAVALVTAADVNQQLAQDKTGFIAIGEDAIVLSGIENQVQYNASRDWYVPGTDDAIRDMAWQKAATHFARQYNVARLAQVQTKP
jgi:hypothetical protein